jgi:hypothetical protein
VTRTTPAPTTGAEHAAGGSRWCGDISARVAQEIAGAIAGTGGPVGVTTDGRAVAVVSTAGTDASASPPGGWNPLGPGTFPIFRFGWAPAGLATRRQLAACGLRPGGQSPVARIEWRSGRRWADLYLVSAAKPKRAMTPAKATAVAAAILARRTCRECGAVADYCLPIRYGRRCLDCIDPAEFDGRRAA